MLAKEYDLFQAIKRCDSADELRLTELAKMLKENVAELMRLILFVETNTTILNHILTKIDKHTLAFENPNFHKFFKLHYTQEKSILKRFLEHPGLLRAYFQMKHSARKLEEKVTQKPEGYVVTDKIQELLPDVINNFEVMEDNPVKKMPSMNDKEEEPLVNEVSKQTTRRYLSVAKSLLTLQTNFFQQTSENVFDKFGITLTDYCNIPELEAKAEKNYNNEMLTKDEFINTELEYNENEKKEIKKKPCYSMFDLFLVFLHTFAFITAYYGLALTSYIYSEDLGIKKSLSGVLQAATPMAAVIFGFFMNYITLNNRYRGPYFIALFLLLAGMILYYIAHTFNDDKTVGLIILIVGRTLFGMGGSRLMTRKFIAINVEMWAQSTYSTLLVSISAFGICFGPGISAVLQFANEADLGATDLFDANIMAFMFIFVFAILIILFFFFFKGYDKTSDENMRRIEFTDSILEFNASHAYTVSNRNLFERKEFYKTPNFKVSNFDRQAVNSHLSASNLTAFKHMRNQKVPILKAFFPNAATIVISLIFLIIKIIQEAFFTEIPQMSKEYYNHDSQWVGWFLLLSSVYVMPTALIGVLLNKKLADRYVLVIALIVYLIGTLIKINYEYDQPMPQAQYYIGSAIVFIGSLLAEAASIAIMAKVISPNLKKGFLNAGLLSGTGDTVGRTLGNVSFTIFSSIDTLAAYPGIWYIVATGLLVFCLLLTLIFFKSLQKYSVIKIISDDVKPVVHDVVDNQKDEVVGYENNNFVPEH